eukprot:NODE_249_length_12946_cov_0.357438.p6 type:complete len:363 gc:universal NODE_249_length_12946_cov_0.357438:2675-3763(+)
MTTGFKRILKAPLQIPGHAPLTRMAKYMEEFMKTNKFHRGAVPPPLISIKENFDDLNFPKDHVGRSKSDTYYIGDKVLRTHATCHQLEMLKFKQAYWICDTYRRDEIDKTHYPIFHQMDAVKVFDFPRTDENVKKVVRDLKEFIESFLYYMIRNTFPDVKFRWVDEYFPFTNPSFELEAFLNNNWVELLGCGVIEDKIIQRVHPGKIGWAFGMGLERVCMLLYSIPDIRLFWLDETRFTNQFPLPTEFKDSVPKQVPFVPFSFNPPCYKEISLFIPNANELDPIDSKTFDLNRVYEIMRSHEELIEDVNLKEKFYHPKHKKWSLLFRITYRALNRNLSNNEINEVQAKIKKSLVSDMGVEIR